jgi:hypothetical protein
MKKRESSFTKELAKPQGEICWGVAFSQALNLSMSFGKPHLSCDPRAIPKSSWSDFDLGAGSFSLRNPRLTRCVRPEGQYWLCVYISYWSIRFEKHLLASTSSPLRRIQKACADLAGQKVRKITVNRETGKTRFEFDLGSVLEVRRMEQSSKDELWSLSCPNSRYLKVYGDGTYTQEGQDQHYPIPQRE